MNIFGARGSPGDIQGFMSKVSALERKHGSTIQFFRADRVFGKQHLAVALEKARRSTGAGRNMSKNLGMEILLYAAAERQITEAIRKLGISEESDAMAVLIVGDADPGELLAELGLERDDSVLATEGKDHSIFSITQGELEMFGEARIQDLVLEKMALSEVLR